MVEVAFSDIVEAAEALEGVIVRTPVVYSAKIDEIAGRKVFMKCENAQHVKAFKFRGASNAVRVLGDEQRMVFALTVAGTTDRQSLWLQTRGGFLLIS